MDVTYIKQLTVPGSRAGGGYINDILASKAKGHRYSVTPAFSVLDFDDKGGDRNTATVTFRLTTSDSQEFGHGYSKTYPGGSANGRIVFHRVSRRWLVFSQQFDE